MTDTIRVVVVDDHPVFRIGMTALLGEFAGIEVVAQCANQDEALRAVEASGPDLVLMDIDLGSDSGVAATRLITQQWPDVKVLIVSVAVDDTTVFAALRAGARGYLVKGADPDQVERAVRAVAAGEVLLSHPVAISALAQLVSGTAVNPEAFPQLTAREREVLDLVARGHDNSTIANLLVVTNKTIRNYLHSILTKLHVADRSALIVKAREAGLGQSE